MARTLLLRSCGAWLAGTAIACVGLPPGPPAGGTTGTTGSSGEENGATGSGSLDPPSSAVSSSDSSAVGDDASSTGPALASSTSNATSGGSSCKPPGVTALGGECMTACDCQSEQCFELGVQGGVCSECDEDVDCASLTGFGCNAGNPLLGIAAVCSLTGDEGEGCQSQDACADGLLCAALFDVSGILELQTCSRCGSDEDCPGGRLCAPSYDLAGLSGFRSCVTPGTVPNGEGCTSGAGGSGGQQCESGHCVEAAVQGIPLLDVCSPCGTDMDCPDGLQCMLPFVEFEMEQLKLVPGACG